MPDREPCCTQPANLAEVPTGKPDLILRVCQICGRRHFELTVDPGKLGLAGVGMGEPPAGRP